MMYFLKLSEKVQTYGKIKVKEGIKKTRKIPSYLTSFALKPKRETFRSDIVE